MKKICSKCGVEKAVSEFHKLKLGKFGVRGECKICGNEFSAKQYQKNKGDRKEYARRYRKENPKAVKETKKLYRQKNREKIREYNREYLVGYRKEKYANDPLFRLSSCVRNFCSRITYAVKEQKELHSLEYLGCSLEEFKLHIESLWLEGMTWENHGVDGWHIDHIIPIDHFVKNSDDPWEASHYTNLQPLWAKDNLSKGNKLLD